MASQPLNSTISVQQRVRTFRQDVRHESVKSLMSNGFRSHAVSVPGEEILVGQTRETLSAGESPIVTTSLTKGRTLGLAVCRVPESLMTLSELLTATNYDYDGAGSGKAIHTLDYPVRLPGVRDIQFGKKSAYLTTDLHGQVRAGHSQNI